MNIGVVQVKIGEFKGILEQYRVNKKITFILTVYEELQNEFIFACLQCCHFHPETTNINYHDRNII